MSWEFYSQEKHGELFAAWWLARLPLAKIIDPSRLPRIGIVVNGEAMGFLVQTDTIYAMAEFLLTKPGTPSIRSARNIDEVMGRLRQAAVDLGYEHAFALILNPNVAKHSHRHGTIARPDLQVVEWRN